MPARKRHDPPQRPTPVDGGIITDDMTVGKDSDRHYVYVNPVPLAGQDQIGMYEARGYVVEEYGPNTKLRPLNASKRSMEAGKPVSSVGLVLMSCDKAEYDRRAAAGESHCQQMDKRMLAKGELDDGFRGGNGFRVRASAGADDEVDARLGGFNHG
jgi:hypothetical protein